MNFYGLSDLKLLIEICIFINGKKIDKNMK